MKKRFLLVLIFLISFYTLFGISGNLLDATEPIVYGQTLFKERIAKQTEDGREAVGLVLSGGSARAFAHIGVLELLEEQDIIVDFIISNSMGSIVGILYAAGLSPNQIRTVISELDVSQLFDFTFPLQGGVLDISRFISVVVNYLGKDLTIESLPIPIMIVSEDLVTKRQVHIMEGPLEQVFAAAFALPVYFSPVKYNDHFLVDGGITNLVPLETAYSYADNVIVSTTFYEGKNINLRNPLTTLNVSIDIGKRRAGVQELINHPEAIWIRCDVEEFSFMDFSAVKELAQIGYASALKELERLNKIEKRTLPYAILESRLAHEAKESKVRNAYNLYQRGPLLGFSQQLFFGLRSFNHEADRWYLRDDLVVGLVYQLRYKSLWFSLYGGAMALPFDPMSIYPAITARLSVQVLNPLIVEGDIVFTGDEALVPPKFYYRLGSQIRHKWKNPLISATVLLGLEEQLDIAYNLQEMLFNTSLNLRWDSKKVDKLAIDTELGWQLAGNWNRQFLHSRLDALIPLVSYLNLKVGYTGRYALDDKGTVPLYYGDGFKSSNKNLLSQGRLFLTENANNTLIISRIGIDWQPSYFKPTAAEALIFEDSVIGLFSDFLWNKKDEPKPEMVVGMKLGTTISFLGLNSMPVSVYVGYDTFSENIAWGFMFGR
jgi:NTE family protein